MKSVSMARLGLLVFLAGALSACSSNQLKGDLGIKGAPDWVNEGTQVVNDKDGRLIHGVGMAPNMNDLSLQTSTADDRARTEVARVLNSFMHVVSQDYSASAGSGQDQQSEQSVSRQIQNITEQNVSGARIIRHWRNEKDGSVWSIAELDLKQVKDMVANSKDMNGAFRDYFNSHADNIFDGMPKGDH
ncbi:MAG TPA: hypothetical protein VF651_08465 [Gammaproteobacteria bacterium]